MERAYSKAAGDIHRPAGDGPDPKGGIYTLLKGGLVLAMDEFQMGFGKGFSVEVKNDYAVVRDYGRGIPLESVVSAQAVYRPELEPIRRKLLPPRKSN